MHIDYTFKVNAFSVEKEVISVSYMAVDETLELHVYHIPQLGVEKQDMVDFSKGVIDATEFKVRMRKTITDAGTLPLYRWNSILEGRELLIPAGAEDMLGVEWPVVTEPEVLVDTVEIL